MSDTTCEEISSVGIWRGLHMNVARWGRLVKPPARICQPVAGGVWKRQMLAITIEEDWYSILCRFVYNLSTTGQMSVVVLWVATRNSSHLINPWWHNLLKAITPDLYHSLSECSLFRGSIDVQYFHAQANKLEAATNFRSQTLTQKLNFKYTLWWMNSKPQL